MVADRIFPPLCHPERSEAESNFLRGEAPAPSKKQARGMSKQDVPLAQGSIMKLDVPLRGDVTFLWQAVRNRL